MLMKISLSQRICFFTVTCCLLFFILISSLVWSLQQVDIALSRDRDVHQVNNYANTLKQLIISDSIYADDYSQDKWLSSQLKLINLLKLIPSLTPQQQTIQNSIHSQNKNIKLLFNKMLKDQFKNASRAIKTHFKMRLITQLEIIRADLVQFSSLVQQDIYTVIKRQALFIISVLLVSIFFLLYGAFRWTQIFRTSLNEVKSAFEKNHSGHFQKIKLSYHSNEFDSIVHEFNAMNHKLSKTTVSLEVMKKTVEDKTHILEQLSNTDPLTKVANRRALYQRGNLELSREHRTHNKLTVMLLDCDYFKQVNDQFGHQGGDDLLKHICKICNQEIRDIDFLARFGGEEFVIILPDCDINGGVEIANRIQSSLAKNPLIIIKNKEVVNVTLSIGICTLSNKHRDFEQLINDADKSMYQAKMNGRNRIEVSGGYSLH